MTLIEELRHQAQTLRLKNGADNATSWLLIRAAAEIESLKTDNDLLEDAVDRLMEEDFEVLGI